MEEEFWGIRQVEVLGDLKFGGEVLGDWTGGVEECWGLNSWGGGVLGDETGVSFGGFDIWRRSFGGLD